MPSFFDLGWNTTTIQGIGKASVVLSVCRLGPFSQRPCQSGIIFAARPTPEAEECGTAECIVIRGVRIHIIFQIEKLEVLSMGGSTLVTHSVVSPRTSLLVRWTVSNVRADNSQIRQNELVQLPPRAFTPTPPPHRPVPATAPSHPSRLPPLRPPLLPSRPAQHGRESTDGRSDVIRSDDDQTCHDSSI